MAINYYTQEELFNIAKMAREGHSAKEISIATGRPISGLRSKMHRHGIVIHPVRAGFRSDELPEDYYDGVAAMSEDQCPFVMTDIRRLCWWKAGFHDARRGLA